MQRSLFVCRHDCSNAAWCRCVQSGYCVLRSAPESKRTAVSHEAKPTCRWIYQPIQPFVHASMDASDQISLRQPSLRDRSESERGREGGRKRERPICCVVDIVQPGLQTCTILSGLSAFYWTRSVASHPAIRLIRLSIRYASSEPLWRPVSRRSLHRSRSGVEAKQLLSAEMMSAFRRTNRMFEKHDARQSRRVSLTSVLPTWCNMW